MTSNNDLDYEAEYARLDDLERQQLGHDKIMQRIGAAAARYQLDQAISLAILADGVERLVAHITGAVPEADVPEADAAPEQVWTLATEAEVGDRVVRRESDGQASPHADNIVPSAITDLGTSEGDIWLKLDGSDAKVWAKDYVIVEGAEDADEELADRMEAESVSEVPEHYDEKAVEAWGNEDDDFAPPAPADGFSALKAGKGKSKGKK